MERASGAVERLTTTYDLSMPLSALHAHDLGGLEFDEAAGVLWARDDDSEEPVRIE